MKKTFLSFLSLLFFVLYSLAQKTTDKAIPEKNIKIVYRDVQTNNPLFFTSDNILLTKNQWNQLEFRDKIKSINVVKDKNAQELFGALGKNGIIIMELKDTVIESENLLEYLNRSHPDKNIQITDIRINGLQTTDKKIKYSKWQPLKVDYYTNKNIYNILTEE